MTCECTPGGLGPDSNPYGGSTGQKSPLSPFDMGIGSLLVKQLIEKKKLKW